MGGARQVSAIAHAVPTHLQHSHEARPVQGQAPRPRVGGGVGETVGSGGRGRSAEHVGRDAVHLGGITGVVLVRLCRVEHVVREAGAWGKQHRQQPRTQPTESAVRLSTHGPRPKPHDPMTPRPRARAKERPTYISPCACLPKRTGNSSNPHHARGAANECHQESGRGGSVTAAHAEWQTTELRSVVLHMAALALRRRPYRGW